MKKSKVSKNGMITLPSQIREELDIAIGDEVGFQKVDGNYVIVGIKSMEDLIDPDHMDATRELIEEMRRDRAKE